MKYLNTDTNYKNLWKKLHNLKKSSKETTQPNLTQLPHHPTRQGTPHIIPAPIYIRHSRLMLTRFTHSHNWPLYARCRVFASENNYREARLSPRRNCVSFGRIRCLCTTRYESISNERRHITCEWFASVVTDLIFFIYIQSNLFWFSLFC